MKNKFLIPLCLCVLLLSACVQPGIGRLVGSDRDEHGCKSSAGYTWSYALHSCVRLWEAGIRFDSGPKSVFLIFSEDSTFAEIFPPNGGPIICKRQKDSNIWVNRKGRESVSISNGVICAKVNEYSYTRNQ